MELVKNIFFNTDKLIENSTVKISYTGKFFTDGCEKTFIHYGFGNEWNNVNEVEMEKTELGFQTEITLAEGETFNLCFHNENNEWDNNDNQNYTFELEKATNELVVLEDEPMAIGVARPLRRTIQNLVEDSLAEEILDNKLKKGKLIKFTAEDGKIKQVG